MQSHPHRGRSPADARRDPNSGPRLHISNASPLDATIEEKIRDPSSTTAAAVASHDEFNSHNPHLVIAIGARHASPNVFPSLQWSSECCLSDFDYYLPDELIAQEPLPDRAGRGCSCLIAPPASGKIAHSATSRHTSNPTIASSIRRFLAFCRPALYGHVRGRRKGRNLPDQAGLLRRTYLGGPRFILGRKMRTGERDHYLR